MNATPILSMQRHPAFRLCQGSSFPAGALGYMLNLLFIVAERRFVHWGGK